MIFKRIAALVCVVGLLAGACGSDSDEAASPAATAAPTTAAPTTAAPAPATADDGDGEVAAKVSVAILLPCAINDLSWCQAAYEGVKELEAEGLIDLQFVENAPFDAQGATRIMSGFANDGVDLIIGHSFDYGAPIHELAPEFPDSHFAWQGSCGGWCGVEGPNVVDYAMNMYEPAYLAGILAGGISQTGVLGTNSGYDIPACRASVEAFLLGAQEVNPAAKRLDAFLGSWIDAALSKEATAAQADQGADVFMACGNAGSFGMLAEVAERDLSGFGYVYDESALAPGNVVASMWSKFGVNIRTMIAGIQNGTWEEYLTTPMSGGAFELLMHSDFDAAEISAEAMALYETRLAGIMDGTFEVPFIGAAPEEVAAKVSVAILLPCAINDLSWCQAAYEGVKELEAEGLIDLQFVENAPFDAQGATRIMSGFANDGVDLIIGHSFDYGAPIHELAPEFPDSHFAWQGSCGGWCGVEGPNVVDYAMNMYEPAYLAGILAGGISQTGVLGTNSGYDIPACRASVEAFLLGAQEVNPAAKRLDAFLGSWIDAALSKEATAAQADQGADVFMACGNAGSFGMLAEVAERDLSGFGYVYDESALAPGNVVASMWSKFGVNIRTMIAGIQNGTWEEYLTTPMSGGAFELLMHSDFDAAEISAEAMALYETRLAGIMDGTFEVPFIGAAPEAD